MIFNPDFKGTPLQYSLLNISEMVQVILTADHSQKVICALLQCAIANDLDRSSSSFKLFCLLFQSVIEHPGDLMKDDIADDLEWPLMMLLLSFLFMNK